MATSPTFWARADSITANNSTLNPIGDQFFPATEIYFESGTLGSNTTGDLIIDVNGTTPDPDTTVWVNGVEYQFFFVVSGTLPNNSQVSGSGLAGQQVTLIEIIGLPSGNNANTQLFFTPNGFATEAQMNAIGDGAIPLGSTTTTPPPICFQRGTLIATPKGQVAVEDLRAGDQVLTASGAVATVRFIASRPVAAAEILFRPEMRPVCIPEGTLGHGLPEADLWVSPQHRVLIRGWEAETLFGEAEVLVPAKHLRFARGVAQPLLPEEVEYFHLMLDRHDIVLSNGAETESLYPGDSALVSLTDDARRLMEQSFPEFAGDWSFYGPTARRTLTGREAAALWTRMAPLGSEKARTAA